MVTFKLWAETRKYFRLISAMTGETILEVAHRLVVDEWKKLKNDTSAQDPTESDN